MTIEQIRLTAMQMALQNDPTAHISVLINRAGMITDFITKGDNPGE